MCKFIVTLYADNKSEAETVYSFDQQQDAIDLWKRFNSEGKDSILSIDLADQEDSTEVLLRLAGLYSLHK